MTCATCPNCGHDLERLGRVEIGHLTIEDDGRVVRWRGQVVRMPTAQRLIVRALAGSAGHVMRLAALIEAIDSESGDPVNIINVHVCRARSAFRDIDPGFDEIETVWGVGLRWRDDSKVLLRAA